MSTEHLHSASAALAGYNEALRSYMLRVYNYMAAGLCLSGAVAGVMMKAIVGNPALLGLVWVFTFLSLGLIFALSFGINRFSVKTVQGLYWAFTASIGVSLSTIFLVYELGSVVRVLLITAGTFGAMSLWGYTTKSSLERMGSFLIMGLFGVIIAMIVNFFLQSTGLQFLISLIGVVIFTLLTAYDTQKIKTTFLRSQGASEAIMEKSAVMGAVALYLDFINLFQFLLYFLGQRR